MAKTIVVYGHSFVHWLPNVPSFQYNLGLDERKYQVDMYGLRGLSLDQRDRLHSHDELLAGKDLVILDIGSNDLCLESLPHYQFGLNIVSYASYLHLGLGTKKVAIMQCLPRRNEPFIGYNHKVIESNIAVESLVATSELPIYFWKHRGMWKTTADIYSPDGVHLSYEVGYPKYIRSVRDCIIRMNNWNFS